MKEDIRELLYTLSGVRGEMSIPTDLYMSELYRHLYGKKLSRYQQDTYDFIQSKMKSQLKNEDVYIYMGRLPWCSINTDYMVSQVFKMDEVMKAYRNMPVDLAIPRKVYGRNVRGRKIQSIYMDECYDFVMR